jgi:hypothetical protein
MVKQRVWSAHGYLLPCQARTGPEAGSNRQARQQRQRQGQGAAGELEGDEVQRAVVIKVISTADIFLLLLL